VGLATYGSVRYREIYPAVDVVYRGNQRQMEFDLVLKAEPIPPKSVCSLAGRGNHVGP